MELLTCMPDPVSLLARSTLWFCLAPLQSSSVVASAAEMAVPPCQALTVTEVRACRQYHTRATCYLLSRGSCQDKGGKDREGVLGVGWPALDCGPHGKAEERDRLWKREGLIILLWVSAE